MSSSAISTPEDPLQEIIPSYVYEQYADDQNIVAFANAYNTLAQSYLDWFNATPFAVYTSPAIVGPLLDWIGNGIYGIPRPVFSTLTTKFLSDAVNYLSTNTIATDGSAHDESGSSIVSNDDYYKRTITWHAYIGDGRICNVMTIRKRIARFLFGSNGGDISLSQAQQVNIAVVTSPLKFDITIPAGTASSYFQEAFNAGILAFPFQLEATVTIA